MRAVRVPVGRNDVSFSLSLRASAGASGAFRTFVAGEEEVSGRFHDAADARRFALPIYARDLVGKRLAIHAWVASATSRVVEVEIALSRGARAPREGEVFLKKVKLRSGRRAATFRFEIELVDLEAALQRWNHAAV